MALFCRLYSKQFSPVCGLYRTLPQLTKNCNKPWGGISTIQTSTIKYDEDHDERNMRLGRPQSPHLTIYAPQLTSILSITHRMTGAALGGYMMLFGTGVLFCDDWESVVKAMENWDLSPTFWTGVKGLLAFPFIYHTCNGVRHLCWDLGKFLTIKEVYATGYAVIGISAVLTGALLAS